MSNTEKQRKKFKPNRFFGRMLTVRGMTEMAIFIALALVFDLDFLKFRIGEAQSFSITMLPLMIIALRFPIVDAFIGIGGIYGVITMLWDGYGLITYPLDYLLGYGFISIMALFQTLVYGKHKRELLNYLYILLAVISGVTGRVFFSTISGVVIYETAFGASFLYNFPPVGVSGIICAILLMMLFPTLLRFKPEIPVKEAENETSTLTEEELEVSSLDE